MDPVSKCPVAEPSEEDHARAGGRLAGNAGLVSAA